MKYLRLIVCWFYGHIVPSHSNGKNPMTGDGDGYDQFGGCIKCKTLCHRDTHIYGDAIWRTTGLKVSISD